MAAKCEATEHQAALPHIFEAENVVVWLGGQIDIGINLLAVLHCAPRPVEHLRRLEIGIPIGLRAHDVVGVFGVSSVSAHR